MSILAPAIEAILFTSNRPLRVRELQQVTDSDRPTTRRLYEFTVGAATAQKARACVSTPARNWYAMVDRPMPDLSLGS